MKFNLLLLAISFFSITLNAQNDSIANSVPDYKNTIRYNLTPTLILGTGSWVVGYERQLERNRSFSINVGHIQMPRLLENTLDSLNIENNSRRNGVSFAADYRFYMANRNKNKTPDGIYWGPYLTSYYFDSETNLKVIDGDLVKSEIGANTQLWTTMVGVELGYQFVLGERKRWTVDLILIGPSFRYDNIKIKLDGGLDVDKENEYIQGIYDAITTFFPGFKDLALEGEISAKGISSGFGAGYRYVIQVGYRF